MPAVTLAQIAERLGLAHTTVSRALNDHPRISAQTKQRVRDAAQAMDYIANQGARHMRGAATRVVGLVLPDIQNEFFSAAARSMAAHCASCGYQLILGLSEDDPAREARQVRAMRESRVAGLLIAPCHSPSAETAVLAGQVPTVQFLRRHKSLGEACIRADERQGVLQATRHLLSLGHRRIGYIGPATVLSTGADRFAGYEAALAEAGLKAHANLQYFGPATPGAGAAGVAALLAGPEPATALLIGSSQQMLGALRAARERGVDVPRALSMVAHGDARWFEACTPAVSAVALPVDRMCESATRLLFGLIETPASTMPGPVFATSLVLRGTTAAPGRRRS